MLLVLGLTRYVGMQIMRDPDSGNSRGFGFISYDSFEASDSAIEVSLGTVYIRRIVSSATGAFSISRGKDLMNGVRGMPGSEGCDCQLRRQ